MANISANVTSTTLEVVSPSPYTQWRVSLLSVPSLAVVEAQFVPFDTPRVTFAPVGTGVYRGKAELSDATGAQVAGAVFSNDVAIISVQAPATIVLETMV